MFRKKAHALLVTDKSGNLVGIITERDIARALGEHGKDAAMLPVSEIMSLDLVICQPDQSAQEALSMMGKNQVRNLPVVADNGHMLGVVGIMELVQSVLN
jgi:CBS domain-containing protein